MQFKATGRLCPTRLRIQETYATLASILLERPGLILMLGSLAALFLLFAQAAPAAGKPEANPLLQYLPLLPIPFIFYLMLIRPQQQQEKKRREMIDKLRTVALVGTADQVADKLNTLGKRLDLEEIVINTWTFDPQARRHSYALLAKAFGLAAPRSDPS